jgi:hypothetical protein
VIAHASEAIDKMRRAEQKLDPSLKGLGWVLLKDRGKLTAAQRAELDGLLVHMTTTRTRAPGTTVSNCGTFSPASNRTSCDDYSIAGAAMYCARRSSQ